MLLHTPRPRPINSVHSSSCPLPRPLRHRLEQRSLLATTCLTAFLTCTADNHCIVAALFTSNDLLQCIRLRVDMDVALHPERLVHTITVLYTRFLSSYYFILLATCQPCTAIITIKLHLTHHGYIAPPRNKSHLTLIHSPLHNARPSGRNFPYRRISPHWNKL
ncbi:predicted protein [Lichtheimia corymbifera JMRC:FSU:9682]|uniref:Uncharacterized protein n=1 Tax=Lichtheimia corymbifera JMRC:FSU:9682 TaxID=1263082 RepID=A0A068RLU0_9FUNG|nr:predicted protein [Lichtheimia corymbifera JMRC:FSU:9682]